MKRCSSSPSRSSRTSRRDWRDLQRRAATSGLDLTSKDLSDAAESILQELGRGSELSDEQLDAVAGGASTATTSFQNFDQKSNQLFNLLSSVMKSMKDTRTGVIRNMA